jgi:hypothetical protein
VQILTHFSRQLAEELANQVAELQPLLDVPCTLPIKMTSSLRLGPISGRTSHVR